MKLKGNTSIIFSTFWIEIIFHKTNVKKYSYSHWREHQSFCTIWEFLKVRQSTAEWQSFLLYTWPEGLSFSLLLPHDMGKPKMWFYIIILPSSDQWLLALVYDFFLPAITFLLCHHVVSLENNMKCKNKFILISSCSELKLCFCFLHLLLSKF